jgi:hypothetical protein
MRLQRSTRLTGSGHPRFNRVTLTSVLGTSWHVAADRHVRRHGSISGDSPRADPKHDVRLDLFSGPVGRMFSQ